MTFNRRKFLKQAGVSLLPVVIPTHTILANATEHQQQQPAPAGKAIRFFGDGEMYEPGDYLDILQQIQSVAPIIKDRYGTGGAVEELEKKFAEITGKEKAIYLPSGTMANQLAIAALSGENTKVFVQETSHVYRDEADAAQSVFQKRLMPLAANEAFFTVDMLKKAVESLPEEEVFRSGIGAVSIENPVRRADGRVVPVEEISRISDYCRSNNIKLHLDGARLYMASNWTGVSIKRYAAYFDTVYISLYKYLGASGGAILCGDRTLIDRMPHYIKIHGGSVYGSWANAAMALHRLNGLEARLKDALTRAIALFNELNKLPGLSITALDGGTNIYRVTLPSKTDGTKMQAALRKDYNIFIPRPDQQNQLLLTVNETILYQEISQVLDAFKKCL